MDKDKKKYVKPMPFFKKNDVQSSGLYKNND